MDKYQQELEHFLRNYAQNQAMDLQTALRDMLGDLHIVAKELNLNFESALKMENADSLHDIILRKFYDRHTHQFEVAGGDDTAVFLYHTVLEYSVKAYLNEDGRLIVERL